MKFHKLNVESRFNRQHLKSNAVQDEKCFKIYKNYQQILNIKESCFSFR